MLPSSHAGWTVICYLVFPKLLIQNATDRVLARTRRAEHIIPTLQTLPWLVVMESAAFIL